MAENIVGNLFGVDLGSLRQQQDMQNQASDMAMAQLTPAQQINLNYRQAGRAIGRGVGGLLGMEDPMLTKQKQANAVLQEVQASMSPEDLQDPAKLSQAVFEAANKANLPDLANQAYQGYQNARLQNAKIGQEVATANKANWEAATKQQDYIQQQKAQQAIGQLWQAKQANGEVPTNEEIIGVASQFMPAEKLATLMQTSSDKAAYRDSMIQQAKVAAEARLEAARERGATQLEIAKMNAENRAQIAQLNASIRAQTNANKGLTGREARYADNVAIAANEVIGGVGNLINMPFTSSTGVFGTGVGAAQSSESIFGAPIGALKNRVTSDNVQRYNAEISNIGKYFATLQTGGLQSTAGAQKQFENQFSIKDGDSELTRLTKLAQMRQTFERVADIKTKSKTTPEEQKADWDNWLQQIKENIPITVNDVNKIANSKRPTQTMEEAMGIAKKTTSKIDGASNINNLVDQYKTKKKVAN